jgi:hypothetical protein
VSEALSAVDPANKEWQRHLSVAYSKLGKVATQASKLDEACLWFEKDLAVTRALADADPTHTLWQRDLLISHLNLATVYAVDPERASPHLAQATEIYERLRHEGAFSDDAQFVRISQILYDWTELAIDISQLPVER